MESPLSTAAKVGIAIGVTGVLAIGAGLRYLVKSGYFTHPTCSLKQAGAMRVAYKIYKGDYSESGSKFDDVFDIVRRNGGDIYSSNIGLSLYYDSPAICPTEHLRYAVGCQIQENQPQLEKDLAANGYKFENFPECKCAFTSFPFYSMMSIILASQRVYGKIYSFAKSQFSEPPPLICLELYPKGRIEYYIPVDTSLDPFFLGLEPVTEKYLKSITQDTK